MGAFGSFLGATAGVAMDPVLLIAALLTGLVSRNWKVFLLALVIAGLAVHLSIAYTVMDWRREIGLRETYAEYALMSAPYRLTAFAIIAGLAFGLRQIGRRFVGRTRGGGKPKE